MISYRTQYMESHADMVEGKRMPRLQRYLLRTMRLSCRLAVGLRELRTKERETGSLQGDENGA